MRGLLRLGAAVVAVVTVLAVPAVADDDLAEMFELAATADFFAEGIVMSEWGDDTAATDYDVSRTKGMSMAHKGSGAFMVGGGLVATLHGTDWYALEVSEWAAWSMSERYSLGEPVPTVRLGRAATSIEVMEGDRPRVRLVLDDATSVPLLTEVLDGSGTVFRMATVTDFSAEPTMSGDDMPDEFAERTMIEPASAPASLPTEAFGYLRTDTYGAGPGATQSFYSDGMFSFSVFVTDGAAPPEFESGRLVVVDDAGPYRRIVTPSQVWMHWSVAGVSHVLVGDLPPDHLDRVLTVMPEPRPRGVLMRMLERLFG